MSASDNEQQQQAGAGGEEEVPKENNGQQQQMMEEMEVVVGELAEGGAATGKSGDGMAMEKQEGGKKKEGEQGGECQNGKRRHKKTRTCPSGCGCDVEGEGRKVVAAPEKMMPKGTREKAGPKRRRHNSGDEGTTGGDQRGQKEEESKGKEEPPKRTASVASQRRTTSRQSDGQHRGYVKRSMYAPYNEGMPMLRIYRTFRDASGTEYNQVEVIEDGRLVENYLKMRTLVSPQRLRDFAFEGDEAIQDFKLYRRKMVKRFAYYAKKRGQEARNERRRNAYYTKRGDEEGTSFVDEQIEK